MSRTSKAGNGTLLVPGPIRPLPNACRNCLYQQQVARSEALRGAVYKTAALPTEADRRDTAVTLTPQHAGPELRASSAPDADLQEAEGEWDNATELLSLEPNGPRNGPHELFGHEALY
jgi:hypothetical protein